MQRVIIIANGTVKNAEFYRQLIKENDYIICADGGFRHALVMGIRPHLIVGDGDSLDSDLRRQMKGLHLNLLHDPRSDQEKSDLELSLDYAVALDPEEIIICGALGGERVDHIYINILLLTIPFERGIRTRIIDERQEIQLMDRVVTLTGKAGDFLSLFALTPVVTGVTTDGLKYPLTKETLYFASSRGLSNRFTGTTAKVTVESGRLLVVRTAP